MQWLRDLASVVIRPRRTMRRILDAPRDRMVLPLALLAILSGIIGDVHLDQAGQAWRMAEPRLRLFIPLIVAGVIAAMLLVFYVLAWVAYFVGRSLEGTASVKAVRSALAWGLAPSVWALLYRIPAMWFKEPENVRQIRFDDFRFTLGEGVFSSGCGAMLFFGILDLAVIVGWLVITSHTLAEANGFSAPRGFATIAICLLAPVVIAVAAFLAA